MRIDFYHINLLKNTERVKKVNTIDTECNTATNYNHSSKAAKLKKNNSYLIQDYLNINDMLNLEDDSLEDKDDFLSDEEFSRLKKSISNDEYVVNLKALSMSLIKYIERG